MRTPHAALALAALTLATGCSEAGFTPQVDEPIARPVISVYPPEGIAFGEAGSGEEIIKEFQIRNDGTEALEVTQLAIRDRNPSFYVIDPVAFTLLPDELRILQVAFSPKAADTVLGAIDIGSNDDMTGTVGLDLNGEGLVPQLDIDPWEHNYGSVLIGCEDTQSVTLSNVGREDLVIDDVSFGGDAELRIQGEPALPLVLPPGGSHVVDILFAPDAEVDSDAFLTVLSNDPRGELEADQTGAGAYDDLIEESFDMPVAPPVDILFAVDQSCSMRDDADRLASNFGSFVDQIDSVTTGWRVGVATADDGCFNNGIIDRRTSGYRDRFRSAVLTWNGGRYTEALLTLAKVAMERSSGGCNAGFLRPEAMTHIILVSDEPEQSGSGWKTLVDQIRNLHPADRRQVKISAVAGDYPRGCGTAQAGEGYYQAVEETGGEYLSICDTNWARHVDRLAKASVEGLGRFDLQETPDARTLEVFVDSVQWTDGFHTDGNTLVFDKTPPEGANVFVRYHNLACQ